MLWFEDSVKNTGHSIFFVCTKYLQAQLTPIHTANNRRHTASLTPVYRRCKVAFPFLL
jgi:hypothetical protein